MNDILSYLEQLDLSDVEAKLYLNLLRSGPLTVRELAETIEMKRTTAYFYIDQLIEKGLIVKIIKGNNKLLAANDPKESLEYLVKKKVQSAQTIQAKFPTMIHTMTTALPAIKDVGDAEITFYKGKNGVNKIYEDALKAKEVRSYVNLSEIAAVFPENENLFANIFKKNKDLTLFEIVENSQTAKKQIAFAYQSERYFSKFLPERVKLTATDVLIYDGKVGVINVRGKATGVILHNIDYYNLSKELFDFMWSVLPETNLEELRSSFK